MQKQSESNPFPYNITVDYQGQNASDDNNGQHVQQQSSNQQQQLNNFMGTFFQNNQNNNNGQAWRTCRFCQQNAFVTVEGLADHEGTCHIQVNQQQIQQLLAQQQFQQQQQQQHQLNYSEQQQTQAQLFGNQAAAYHLSQLLPNPFGNVSQDGGSNVPNMNMSAASFPNQGMNQQVKLENQHQQPMANNDYCRDTCSEKNNSQGVFENAIDRLPEFKPKQKSQSSTPSNANANNNNNNTNSNAINAANNNSNNGAPSGEYFPLSMPEDDDWLTPLHCFVRHYCVEVFVATPDDVAAPCMGKRNPVSVSQVGIRCPFCSPERMGNNETDIARARENGVVYPSLISRIYNATINLLQRHLRTCAFVPQEILARYEELKSSNARSGASKKYWAESALRLGLVDTPNGIRYVKPSGENKDNISATAASAQKYDSSAPPLVLPSDKRYTTAFTFHLMAQMQPCVFTEADRLGRRRGLDVGFAGLACRHCFGAYGTGRFFPSSVKTMSDASKTLDVIYKHVVKCKTCPADIKVGLRNLREFHDSERSKMPFGNQRAFFTKIWGRLHEHDGDEFATPAPAPATVAQAPVPAIRQDMGQQQAPMPALKTEYAAGMGNLVGNNDNEGRKQAAGSNGSSISAKLQDNSMDSLQALYAHFNSTNSKKPTKLVNEAA